ncbi:hypothetical protein [Thiosocius teredinicola]|uniref:hypothetical protein n=1 Tax=Thiosocius teredinicola TaxID=1973002 RepID=UPI000990C6FF
MTKDNLYKVPENYLCSSHVLPADVAENLHAYLLALDAIDPEQLVDQRAVFGMHLAIQTAVETAKFLCQLLDPNYLTDGEENTDI